MSVSGASDPSGASEPAAERPELVDRAAATRVVVVGGGIAGLVAAWGCARVGMPVRLIEADERLGGVIESATLDELTLDLVADAVPLASDALAELIDELGLRHLVERASGATVAVAAPGGPAGALRVTAMPPNLAGIPANVWAEPVRDLIGARGVWRAYLDRLRPPLTIGRERSLGELVRTRMGVRVRDRMVAPLTVGIYGVEPEAVDVDAAVPGLSAALTRAGSLSGAVGQLLPDEDGARAGAGARRATLRGGLSVLAEALAARLRDLGVEFRLGAPVTALRRTESGWTVRSGPLRGAAATADAIDLASADAVTADSAAAMDPASADTFCDVVVLACGARATAALVTPLGVGVDVPPAPARDVVTLVTEEAATEDRDPSVAILCPVPGTSPVATLVDVCALWPSVAAAAGPGRRVLRVALAVPAAAGGAAEPESESENDLVRRAHREAGLLLDGRLGAIRAAAHRRVELAPPASALDHVARTGGVRAAVGRLRGVSAVGAWLSGGGTAAVVDDTVAEIERVRHAALFGSA